MSLLAKPEFNTLQDVLMHELDDLYDAEKRIAEVLPKMINAARARPLKDALQNDLGESKTQLQRLEDLFVTMNWSRAGRTCDAMKGIVKETEAAIGAKGDPDSRDAALIAAMQRIKHYEIAGYGCARTFARRLGMEDVAKQLQDTLHEEIEADRELTEIAEGAINAAAVH